jgi:tetratricopeptide (TPR) repeat protein
MKVAPLIGREDYAGAVQVLEGALTDTSEDLPYLELLAHCHWHQGDEEKAIETARMAINLNPDSFEMPRMLSQILAERENHEEAVKFVKIALKNFPSEPLAAPPSWALTALKIAGKISDRCKHAHKSATEEVRDADASLLEWQAWAKEYLEWYEEARSR